MSDVVACERCNGDCCIQIESAERFQNCPDCHGHGFLLTCRCGHLMPVGERMCSLCESQAEAREEDR